jgi:hypothetical protein
MLGIRSLYVRQDFTNLAILNMPPVATEATATPGNDLAYVIQTASTSAIGLGDDEVSFVRYRRVIKFPVVTKR